MAMYMSLLFWIVMPYGFLCRYQGMLLQNIGIYMASEPRRSTLKQFPANILSHSVHVWKAFKYVITHEKYFYVFSICSYVPTHKSHTL
jgi:hypothetical protein